MEMMIVIFREIASMVGESFMAKPVIQLMLLWQTIPIALLMLIPFAGLNLRMGERRGGLISLLYTLFGCAMLVILNISADRQGNIVLCNIWFVALMAVYFSGWAYAVRAPIYHKLLVLAVMLHCAAILNATSVSFMSLLLDKDRFAEIHTGKGILFLLCLLMAVWLLIFYFLRHGLRKRIPFLGDREAKRGFVYQCITFALFFLTAYDPSYRFQVRQPFGVIPLAVTDLVACMIFFREISREKTRVEADCDLAVRHIQYRQLRQMMEEVRRLHHNMRCFAKAMKGFDTQAESVDCLKRYSAACDWLEQQVLTGDPVVDAVLEHFLFQAAVEKIPVTYRVSMAGRKDMDEMDLTALLNACLENVMEILRTLPPEEKRLSITISAESGILMVDITNSVKQRNIVNHIMEEGIFSECGRHKDEMQQYMSAIVAKYVGFAHVLRKDKIFATLVILCMSRPCETE